MFNVFGNPLFVSVASANQTTISDDLIIGSLINASQGGRSRGGNEEVARMGGRLLGGQRESGSRLGKIISRGGNKAIFNPSLIDINILYNDYRDFIINNYANDDIHIVPINKTFRYSNDKTINRNLTNGFVFRTPETSNLVLSEYSNVYVDYHNLPDKFNYMYIESIQSTQYVKSLYTTRTGTNISYGGNMISPHTGTFKHRESNGTYRLYGGHITIEGSWTVGNVIFSNRSDLNLDEISIVHNANNILTKQEFITNYTNAFNVKFDNSTNQLIENENYYTYNLNDFSDNSITVNNQYINNNSVVMNDNKVAEQLNYTTLFERIISAIKELPQQIRDKFDDFTGGGGTSEPEPVEEGKGFWASLFDAIASLVESVTDFILSIPQLITDLLNGLLDLVEIVVGLFIPNVEQLELLNDAVSNLTDNLKSKFSPIIDLSNNIMHVYGNPKSLYSYTWTFQGVETQIISPSMESSINIARTLLSGTVVLLSFIDIYKRIVGRGDIIK